MKNDGSPSSPAIAGEDETSANPFTEFRGTLILITMPRPEAFAHAEGRMREAPRSVHSCNTVFVDNGDCQRDAENATENDEADDDDGERVPHGAAIAFPKMRRSDSDTLRPLPRKRERKGTHALAWGR